MDCARLRQHARSLLLAALLACAAPAVLGSETARADGCPGSGSQPCPYTAVTIVGQRAEGVLRFPEAVALGPQGNVYVADQLSYVVQRFSPAGVFETEWGSYGGGHGQFGPIGGLAVDGAGNVYVVDSSHDRIQKFDANGNFLLSWGHRGSEVGQFHFGSSQNPTQPPGGGIAVGGEHVYVADSGNNRIERFTLDGREPLAWGSRGSAPGQFIYPRGLAANQTEVLVADDDNHRIQKFDPEGAFQAAVGSEGAGPGQFGFPYGAALDGAGNAYVADDLNHRVVKLTPSLAFHGAWGGFGSKPGQLAFPRALAADGAGNTYVADTANDRIEVFGPEGNFLRSFAGPRRAAGVLTAPRGVAADPTGRLLVSDSVENRLQLFAPLGAAFAGIWERLGGPPPALRLPAGIGIDPRGSVYISDQGNQRLVRLWGDGTFLAERGGPAAIGGAQLSGPAAIAVNPTSGDIYVADSGHNRLLVYGPEGALLARWGAGGGSGAPGAGPGEFNRPAAVALDAAGNVYVADRGNDRVVVLSPGGQQLRQWGSRGTAEGRLRGPIGIAVDPAGELLVLDSENNRVQAFDLAGRFIARWGRRGVGPGELSQPAALAVDCAGGVYVADTNNNRVQRFQLPSAHGAGCLAPGAWPPPLDVAPELSVRLARRGGVLARRALALTVSCARGCKVLASATLAARGRRAAVRLVGAARPLPAGRPGHLRLRVGPAALRRLQGQLGPRRRLSARVRIVAAGPTGRRAAVTRRYLVSR